MTALLLALVLSITLGAGMITILGPAPAGGMAPAILLVIAPPWGPGAGAIVRVAGGRPLGPVAAPFGTLAAFDPPVSGARLRALGAWASRDAQSLAALCGVRP